MKRTRGTLPPSPLQAYSFMKWCFGKRETLPLTYRDFCFRKGIGTSRHPFWTMQSGPQRLTAIIISDLPGRLDKVIRHDKYIDTSSLLLLLWSLP